GVVLDRYEARISSVEAEVMELKTRLRQSSQNSSKPPSSDGPHVKRKPPRPASGRRRGGWEHENCLTQRVGGDLVFVPHGALQQRAYDASLERFFRAFPDTTRGPLLWARFPAPL